MAVKKKKSNGDCPLSLRANGQFAKKIKGKFHYFGTDREAALQRWADERDYLLAGRPVPTKSGTLPIEELGDLFHQAYSQQVALGETSPRHLIACKATIARLIEFVGEGTKIDTLTPLEWDTLKFRFAEPIERKVTARGGVAPKAKKRRSITTVDGDVRRVLLFVRWCVGKKLLPEIDFGGFAVSSKKVRQKVTGGMKINKALSKTDILAIINRATVQFRPLVLLGINCGLGAGDSCEIEFEDIKKINKDPWIDLARKKTGTPRRLLLWKETIKAINEYLNVRPDPLSERDDGEAVFLTSKKLRWVRLEGEQHIDSAGSTFAKLRKELEIGRGTFYDLRRTFATIALQTLDTEAVRAVMGHEQNERDMTLSIYNQEIGDDRIERVISHVRSWLYA